MVVVAVDMQDHSPRTKSFLGGWRNTVTGLIYHNACTQTHDCGATRSRITQTVAVANAVTEVAHDRAVQVYFLPEPRDRIIAPSASRAAVAAATAAEVGSHGSRDDGEILASLVRTQRRCYSNYRAGIAAATSPRAISQTSDDEDKAERRHEEHSQALSAYEGADFAILNRRSSRSTSAAAHLQPLHNLLDRWRILETERASRTLLGSSRIAVCGLTLSKEVELLRAVHAVEAALRLKRRERKRRRLLDELSKPVAWQDSRGRPILVDTVRAQRARQHRSVYASLANESLSVAERVDLLRGLRRVADMHTCSQSLELVYLVDQELALLACRVDVGRLNWLRNRLRLSFLKLAHSALQGGRLEEPNSQFGWLDASITRLCKTCDRLLPLEKFPRERRLRSSSCVYCTSVRTRGCPRVVYEPYERMLRGVRRREARMGCYGSLAFVVGPKVVCRLVNEVWHGRSGISERDDDLDELRLTRYRREHEWAPWNSLLLTKVEAAVHQGITDIESFYDSRLLHKFRVKNLQARIYFESMAETRGNIVTPSSMED